MQYKIKKQKDLEHKINFPNFKEYFQVKLREDINNLTNFFAQQRISSFEIHHRQQFIVGLNNRVREELIRQLKVV